MKLFNKKDELISTCVIGELNTEYIQGDLCRAIHLFDKYVPEKKFSWS